MVDNSNDYKVWWMNLKSIFNKNVNESWVLFLREKELVQQILKNAGYACQIF